ncbi:pilus assembly protein TadG-related protein [Candidatus Poriferisodalis sp.]|uniref:pilus assembly protein TadG-related protein n=1 Tax=Candidatus Poriferisodalis sp. TaxID=3101277 RepID=UPI003B024595
MDQTGSGTAIGVAVIYPMLIVVIVALNAVISASRTEHSLQAAADRAARSASLCCELVDDARDTARRSLSADFLQCVNDAAEESEIDFFDVSGSRMLPTPIPKDASDKGEPKVERLRVPPAGTVQVHVTCTLSAGAWGRMFAGPAGVQRHAVGQAIVDPYRSRLIPVQ